MRFRLQFVWHATTTRALPNSAEMHTDNTSLHIAERDLSADQPIELVVFRSSGYKAACSITISPYQQSSIICSILDFHHHCRCIQALSCCLLSHCENYHHKISQPFTQPVTVRNEQQVYIVHRHADCIDRVTDCIVMVCMMCMHV